MPVRPARPAAIATLLLALLAAGGVAGPARADVVFTPVLTGGVVTAEGTANGAQDRTFQYADTEGSGNGSDHSRIALHWRNRYLYDPAYPNTYGLGIADSSVPDVRHPIGSGTWDQDPVTTCTKKGGCNTSSAQHCAFTVDHSPEPLAPRGTRPLPLVPLGGFSYSDCSHGLLDRFMAERAEVSLTVPPSPAHAESLPAQSRRMDGSEDCSATEGIGVTSGRPGTQTCVNAVTGTSRATLACALCVTKVEFKQPSVRGGGLVDVPDTGTIDGNQVHVIVEFQNRWKDPISALPTFRDDRYGRDLPGALADNAPLVTFPAGATTRVEYIWDTNGFAWERGAAAAVSGAAGTVSAYSGRVRLHAPRLRRRTGMAAAQPGRAAMPDLQSMSPSSERSLRLLSVVAPMYNEEATAEAFYGRVCEALEGTPFELVVVDDGSSDSTPEILDRLAATDPRVRVVFLSRNFGHQTAITAGLDHARGDAVVMIDADLQDPPEVIPTLVERWRAGSDVVYAVRASRAGETRFKVVTARWFYRLMSKLSNIELAHDAGDFRLMDRRALDALLAMRERSRYLRGMTVWVGFSQAAVTYERDPRHAGETKYTLSKMLRFSLDAIASFSHLPLQAATVLGFVFSLVAFLAIPIVIGLKVAGSYLPGFTTITVLILLLGGIQLIAVGIIGEYVGRIYDEVKHRPLYLVRERRNLGLDESVAEDAQERISTW
jgi:dolichol-phosphate mannosyltransferase